MWERIGKGVYRGMPSFIQRIVYPNGRVIILITTGGITKGWQWDHTDWEPFDTNILNFVPVPRDATIEQF